MVCSGNMVGWFFEMSSFVLIWYGCGCSSFPH